MYDAMGVRRETGTQAQVINADSQKCFCQWQAHF